VGRDVSFLGTGLAGGKHGDQVQGHEQRGEQREGNRQGKIVEQLTGDSLHEDDREEDSDGRERRCRDGGCDLTRAPVRCIENAVALLTASKDALQHDDGVVLEHAVAQGQPR